MTEYEKLSLRLQAISAQTQVMILSLLIEKQGAGLSYKAFAKSQGETIGDLLDRIQKTKP